MKFLLKFFKWFAIILASIIVLMYIFDVDYLLRAVRTIYFKGYTTAFLEDYKEFPNTVLFKNVSFNVEKNDKIAFVSRDPRAMTAFFEILNCHDSKFFGKFNWGVTITTAYLPLDNSEFFNNVTTHPQRSITFITFCISALEFEFDVKSCTKHSFTPN